MKNSKNIVGYRNSILTNEQIKNFQEIYNKQLNIILSDKETLDYWMALLIFLKASLYKPEE